ENHCSLHIGFLRRPTQFRKEPSRRRRDTVRAKRQTTMTSASVYHTPSPAVPPPSTSLSKSRSPDDDAAIDGADIPYKSIQHLFSQVGRDENVDSLGFRDV